MNADLILEKIKNIQRSSNSGDGDWSDWTLEEKIKVLEVYLILCKKEKYIFELIYSNHGCDSWEDIFRDYDPTYLKDKMDGVKIAIENLKDERK